MTQIEASIVNSSLELENLGYTLLKSCINPKLTIDALNELIDEYNTNSPLPWRGGGKWFGHLNYIPSPKNKLIETITNNKSILDLLHKSLGDDYKIVGLAGNANFPGSKNQPKHVDGNLDKNCLVINIPLGTVTELNGSTEVWPGTHQSKISFSKFFNLNCQSVRLNSTDGDILIRYPNLWHRGTPNNSKAIRFMLGILVSRTYRDRSPIIINKEDEESILNLGMPVHYKIGLKLKRGFMPNYFAPNLKGNIKELFWIVLPKLFETLQRIKA